MSFAMTTEKLSGSPKFVTKAQEYEILPPEGGWGYVVTLCLSLFLIVTVVPLATFGMIFGNFLASVADETTGISLTTSFFNTISSFTGLVVNQLLKTMSCRKVGLIGAFLFFIGNFATVFVTSLVQMIISFGIIQGIGFGLMLPACFSCFNEYFDKRKTVMMNIAQVIVTGVSIGCPFVTKVLLDTYGFRGTVAVLSALSLNCFVAMIALQPVKWHARKVPVEYEEERLSFQSEKQYEDQEKQDNIDVNNGQKHIVLHVDEKPLIKRKNVAEKDKFDSQLLSKPRASLVSVGSIALSVGSNLHRIHEEATLTGWKAISKALDLELFKDFRYINMAFGLALSLTSDIAFLSILPMLLANFGFTPMETTKVMTTYFASDLACRILLSIVSAVLPLRNRYLFLAGTLFSAAFRTVFLMNSSFLWILIVSVILGFFRCFIQTPLALVIAEEYPERFPTAFSLYMVVLGIVNLVFGILIAYVKSATQSDEAVVHLLTGAYLLCGIPWCLELFAEQICHRKTKERPES